MAIADLVSTLAKHEAEFIIVGGMAAILRGTPVNTFDLDVVYERSAANIERLLNALEELQAIVRDDPRRLRLNKSHLESPGHKLMEGSPYKLAVGALAAMPKPVPPFSSPSGYRRRSGRS